MSRRLLTCAALLALLTGCAETPAAPADIDWRMARGLNLRLAIENQPQSGVSLDWPQPEKSDLALIRDLGFRHVRIRINPVGLMGQAEPGALSRAGLRKLRQTLDRVNNAGLTTILTMQPARQFKSRLQPRAPDTERFAAFWRALASELADYPVYALVFEPLNEPEHESADAWRRVQTRLVGAVRAGAPGHRIIVAGHKFSSIPQLLALRPLPYGNLAYSFHFYEPHNFTHQGANWGYEMWQFFHGWPYPSSPEAVAPLLPNHIPDAQPHLEHYGRQRWNKTRLAAELDQAKAWADRHNVGLICTEFGVYRDGVEPHYRNAWLRDVEALLEARNIDWTLWDFAGNFGIVRGPAGAREVDADTLRALDLKVNQ